MVGAALLLVSSCLASRLVVGAARHHQLCSFFGFSAEQRHCELYSSCRPRNSSAPGPAAPSYTTYKLRPGPSPPPPSGGCWLPESATPGPTMLVVYARPLHDGAVSIGRMNRGRENTVPPSTRRAARRGSHRSGPVAAKRAGSKRRREVARADGGSRGREGKKSMRL